MKSGAYTAVEDLQVVDVVQEPGELLFVPSGWYHQVENLTDCISINHNWLTPHNAHWALRRLAPVLADIKHGLGEEADDASLCESLLERRVGMGLGGLCDLLEGVIERRMPSDASDELTGAPVDAKTATVARTRSEEFARESAAKLLKDTLDLMEQEYVVGMGELEPEREMAFARQRSLLAALDAA